MFFLKPEHEIILLERNGCEFAVFQGILQDSHEAFDTIYVWSFQGSMNKGFDGWQGYSKSAGLRFCNDFQ